MKNLGKIISRMLTFLLVSLAVFLVVRFGLLFFAPETFLRVSTFFDISWHIYNTYLDGGLLYNAGLYVLPVIFVFIVNKRSKTMKKLPNSFATPVFFYLLYLFNPISIALFILLFVLYVVISKNMKASIINEYELLLDSANSVDQDTKNAINEFDQMVLNTTNEHAPPTTAGLKLAKIIEQMETKMRELKVNYIKHEGDMKKANIITMIDNLRINFSISVGYYFMLMALLLFCFIVLAIFDRYYFSFVTIPLLILTLTDFFSGYRGSFRKLQNSYGFVKNNNQLKRNIFANKTNNVYKMLQSVDRFILKTKTFDNKIFVAFFILIILGVTYFGYTVANINHNPLYVVGWEQDMIAMEKGVKQRDGSYLLPSRRWRTDTIKYKKILRDTTYGTNDTIEYQKLVKVHLFPFGKSAKDFETLVEKEEVANLNQTKTDTLIVDVEKRRNLIREIKASPDYVVTTALTKSQKKIIKNKSSIKKENMKDKPNNNTKRRIPLPGE